VKLTAKPPLGLHARPFSEAKRAFLPEKVTSGVVIGALDFDGFLDRNGLVPSDVLTQLGSTPLTDAAQLERWYSGAKIGSSVGLDCFHPDGNQYKRVSLRLKVDGQGADWVGEHAYDRYPQPGRDKLKEAWREEVRSIRASYLKLKKEDTPKGRRKAQQEINSRPFGSRIGSGFVQLDDSDLSHLPRFEERLNELRANTDPYLEHLDFPTSWKVGAVGKFSSDLRVLQILSPTEALVEPFSTVANTGPEWVLYMTGVKTQGWADGQFQPSPGVVEIYGTYRYKTASGASRTVPAMRSIQ
jgi:hypothetical protein